MRGAFIKAEGRLGESFTRRLRPCTLNFVKMGNYMFVRPIVAVALAGSIAQHGHSYEWQGSQHACIVENSSFSSLIAVH